MDRILMGPWGTPESDIQINNFSGKVCPVMSGLVVGEYVTSTTWMGVACLKEKCQWFGNKCPKEYGDLDE